MTPDSELERLFPVKPIDPKETAEDRWEFNQQTEALYQARINKPIDPPFPAVTSKPTSDNSAHEAQDVAVLIPVNQIDEE